MQSNTVRELQKRIEKLETQVAILNRIDNDRVWRDAQESDEINDAIREEAESHGLVHRATA